MPLESLEWEDIRRKNSSHIPVTKPWEQWVLSPSGCRISRQYEWSMNHPSFKKSYTTLVLRTDPVPAVSFPKSLGHFNCWIRVPAAPATAEVRQAWMRSRSSGTKLHRTWSEKKQEKGWQAIQHRHTGEKHVRTESVWIRFPNSPWLFGLLLESATAMLWSTRGLCYRMLWFHDALSFLSTWVKKV